MPTYLSKTLFITLLSTLIATVPAITAAKESSPPAKTEIQDYTKFFDESLNDMQEEAEIAKEEGKKGLLIMFEMDECPFCKRMKKTVLNRKEVQDYYKKNFRILSVDIEGDLELTDFAGKETTQKEFSLKEFRVRATPVFQFLDLDGKPIKNGRLTGATRDKNEFMLLGQYIVDGENTRMPFIRYKRKHKQANN